MTGRAHDMWRRGLVKPYLITAVLDMRELDGPNVDAACGVEEPAVDMWEAAELYPTWDQLEALSQLTNWPVAGFFSDLRVAPTVGFTCRRSGGCEPHSTLPDVAGPRRYTRSVIEECPGTVWHEQRGAA